MSHLASRAEEHWRKHLPGTYSQISDPATFFANLAEEAEDQIETLADALAGPEDPAETFMEKVSRLTQARQAAEGQVLREMVLLPEETPDPDLADDEESTAAFEEAVAEFQRLREQLLSGDYKSVDESE